MSREILFKRALRMTLPGAYRFSGVKKDTYAATIVERLYDYYCRGACNVFLEYLLYYRKEFSDFETFLDRKYNLFPEEIKKKKSYFLCHKNLSKQANGHVTELIEDESINQAMQKYLGVEAHDN